MSNTKICHKYSTIDIKGNSMKETPDYFVIVPINRPLNRNEINVRGLNKQLL